MSRTDKDRPWQLLAADQWPGSYFTHSCTSSLYGRALDCDVDENPIEVFKHAFDNPKSRYHKREPNCGWTMRYCSFTPPPRWFRAHIWHEPERVRVRDHLGSMAKEYNTTGTIADGDFPNYQGRGAHHLWH